MVPYFGWTIFVPLVASLLGAGVGAFTAQYIAARNKRNDDRLKELRAASAASTIAYGITDHFLSMKQQILKPMVDNFLDERERFIRADAAPKSPGVSVIVFKVPLDTFRFNVSPCEDLQQILFKDISAQLRPMMVIPILTRTLAMLDMLAEDRNRKVQEFYQLQQSGKEINPFAYYDLPFPKGGADQRYAQSLQHISEHTMMRSSSAKCSAMTCGSLLLPSGRLCPAACASLPRASSQFRLGSWRTWYRTRRSTTTTTTSTAQFAHLGRACGQLHSRRLPCRSTKSGSSIGWRRLAPSDRPALARRDDEADSSTRAHQVGGDQRRRQPASATTNIGDNLLELEAVCCLHRLQSMAR
jgi:hypothetical protein